MVLVNPETDFLAFSASLRENGSCLTLRVISCRAWRLGARNGLVQPCERFLAELGDLAREMVLFNPESGFLPSLAAWREKWSCLTLRAFFLAFSASLREKGSW